MPVASGVVPLAPVVIATVDLDDDPHLGRSQLDDARYNFTFLIPSRRERQPNDASRSLPPPSARRPKAEHG